MSDEFARLAQAARQLVEMDELLGGEFIPAQRNPLPPMTAVTPTATQPAAPAANPRAGGPAGVAPAPQAPPQGFPQELPPMSAEQKAQALKELAAQGDCRRCKLCESRTNFVFGDGDPNARLVFVGEAPGEDEDLQGIPFVGRAGQKLTEMIIAMGLQRQDVYICNVLKCRPPANRTPMPEEALACRNFLVRQLQIIRPEVIVTLGNPATQNLLNTTVGITRLRGQWQTLPQIAPGLGGIAVMPTFHPSYLIRCYTPENRKAVWSDLQKVMERLGLKKK